MHKECLEGLRHVPGSDPERSTPQMNSDVGLSQIKNRHPQNMVGVLLVSLATQTGYPQEILTTDIELGELCMPCPRPERAHAKKRGTDPSLPFV